MSRWALNVVGVCLVLLAFTYAAPVPETEKDSPESAVPSKVTDITNPEAQPEETKDSTEEKASEEIKDESGSKEEEEPVIEGSGLVSNEEAEAVQPDQEVSNQADIEENTGSRGASNEINDGYYTGPFDGEVAEYQLSDQEALELLRELDNPAQVALLIMESEDVNSFLRSVQMLVDQGFISPEYAFYLKEAVSEELEQLLMLRDQEAYADPLGIQDLQQAVPIGNDYVDDLLNRPVPYIPEEYLENTLPYEEPNLYPENANYDVFRQPYSEETLALAEIADIIADRIENGHMSTVRGERIIDILSQLLPEGFWQDDDISDEMMEDLGEAFDGLYPYLPEGDEYRTFETEDEEPLPGGERHIKEEVVVDEEGRPVAKLIDTEEEQETEELVNGEDAEDAEEELEKELLGVEPEAADDVEKALADVAKLATAQETTDEETDENEEPEEEMDKSGLNGFALLLKEGELSDELLKELGLTKEEYRRLMMRTLSGGAAG